ncbi:TonB-dependent receptor [Qipengyuania sp. GH38]|uniref:TonB-dependent receptor n=1 Tax=Qipengyuania intermedia TaxID=2867244 RepID=UPI001C882799|nr:TonB-dependent receptor [Qipengyuania intermedia]MBX7514683.1 TonB-dependent receptor [Qipengyuania intermedia]
MAFRSKLVGGISAGAVTIALAAVATPAMAQEASVEPGDETASQEEPGEDNIIVVEGYRQALETAINLKRDAPVIAEAFSSEDIGKLPDVSIAETLGRLPGLAVQRIDGRAQSLSIRGLGPDYSTSLLNGRQLVSSGDNRAVEYDQYPAELIDQGVIYKVPYAGLIGQGLAGTVDLRTIRPLAKGERIVSLSGRLEFNEDGSLNPDVKGWGYRATGTYVDQFADDTLGLAVGVAYQSSPSQVKKFNAWGYPNDAGYTVLGGMKPFAKSVDLDRLGVFGTLEWEPSLEWNTTIDIFYADYRERIPQRGIEFPLNPGWGSGATIADNSGGDFPNSVTFTGVQPVVRNDYDRKDTETFAAGWNTKYENDDVLLNFDVSYSSSDRRLQQIESYSGLTYAANASGPSDTVTYTRPSSGFPFNFNNTIDYSDTSLIQLTDPRGWGADGIVQAGFINDTSTDDELWSARAEVVGKVDSGWVKNLVAGVAFDDRTKSRDIVQNFLSLAGGPSAYAADGAVTRLPIPSDALLTPIASLDFLGFGPQVAYDPFVLINNGTYLLTDVQSSSLPFPGDWSVNEKVWNGWLRADLEGSLGSIPVEGNIGVQLVFTDQSSDGFQSNGGIGAALVPVEGGDEYAHVLPSATFNFEITPDIKLRLGAARTLARPRMDQLNASYNASIANQPPTDGFNSIFSGGGGNPQLRPYVADGIDASFEWYFGGEGYLALATYYKWLDDFVNPNAPVVRDFSYLVPTLTPTQQIAFAATGNQTLGLVGGPDNGAEGYIFGVEGSIALPLGDMTGFLPGFGVQSSASYTDSKLDVTLSNGETFNVDTPGLSKWVVNSTAYYENSGFEARVSHRYRTGFLAEFIGISASRSFRQTYAESIFDAQIGYRFQEGSSLDGLAFTLQALNLTDEPFINYTDGNREFVIDYEEYGRTYLVGVSYKF